MFSKFSKRIQQNNKKGNRLATVAFLLFKLLLLNRLFQIFCHSNFCVSTHKRLSCFVVLSVQIFTFQIFAFQTFTLKTVAFQIFFYSNFCSFRFRFVFATVTVCLWCCARFQMVGNFSRALFLQRYICCKSSCCL